MDLRRYLFENRITIKQFAELMDCSRQQVSLIKAGKKVSKKFARQVEIATQGAVKRWEITTAAPKLPDSWEDDADLGGKAAKYG